MWFSSVSTFIVRSSGGSAYEVYIIKLLIATTLLNLLLDFDVISYPEEGTGVEILLNDLEGTTGTCCMEAHMHARDQDHSREMHYFNFTTILAATNSFSDENKLGEGGFGPVYKVKSYTYFFVHIEKCCHENWARTNQIFD